MEFTVSLKRFKESFSLVGRVVPTKSPRVVLQSVKVTAGDDALTFEGAGDGVSIRHRLANAGGFRPVEISAPGVCLLPKATADSILSVATGDVAAFRLDDGKVHVRAGSAKWTLHTEPPDAFPAVPDFDCQSFHTLSVADFKRLAKRTLYAVDEDSTRYALGGVCLESTGPDLSATATDGNALAHQCVPAVLTGDAWDDAGQRIIPVATVNILSAMVSDGGSDLSVGFVAATGVRFRFADTVFSGQLLEGRFPRWRQVFPASHEHRITIPCGVFRVAVEQASVPEAPDSARVDLEFSEGVCRLSGSSAEQGVGSSEFPLQWEGRPFGISLNPHYLIPMLKSLGDDAELSCEMTDSKGPFVIRSEDGFQGAVMPLSREG